MQDLSVRGMPNSQLAREVLSLARFFWIFVLLLSSQCREVSYIGKKEAQEKIVEMFEQAAEACLKIEKIGQLGLELQSISTSTNNEKQIRIHKQEMVTVTRAATASFLQAKVAAEEAVRIAPKNAKKLVEAADVFDTVSFVPEIFMTTFFKMERARQQGGGEHNKPKQKQTISKEELYYASLNRLVVLAIGLVHPLIEDDPVSEAFRGVALMASELIDAIRDGGTDNGDQVQKIIALAKESRRAFKECSKKAQPITEARTGGYRFLDLL